MKIKCLLLKFTTLIMSLGVMAFSMNAYAANTRVVTTLDTTAAYLADVSTYGNTVAWQAYDSANAVYRIYYWNGSTIQTISPSTSYAYQPSVYNGTIAWTNGSDIFYWDGTYVNCEPNIIQITNNAMSNTAPSLDNGRIAWSGSDGNDNEIYLWDGTFVSGNPNIIQITDNAVLDSFPKMHNGLIAWRNDWTTSTGGFKLQYWDGTSIKTLAENFSGNDSIGVHNGGIAWVGSVELACGTSLELLYWNGTFTGTTPNITQVTNNNCGRLYPANPSLYNGTITWQQAYAPQEGIFYWNGTTIIPVSEAYDIDGFFKPEIHSGGIAYTGRQSGLSTGLQEIRFVTGLE